MDRNPAGHDTSIFYSYIVAARRRAAFQLFVLAGKPTTAQAVETFLKWRQKAQ